MSICLWFFSTKCQVLNNQPLCHDRESRHHHKPHKWSLGQVEMCDQIEWIPGQPYRFRNVIAWIRFAYIIGSRDAHRSIRWFTHMSNRFCAVCIWLSDSLACVVLCLLLVALLAVDWIITQLKIRWASMLCYNRWASSGHVVRWSSSIGYTELPRCAGWKKNKKQNTSTSDYDVRHIYH